MKYQAVIFDLFGTLIPNFSEREYHQTVVQMAALLSAPHDEFWQLWKAAFDQRIPGILPDLESQIEDICRKLSLPAEIEKVRAAVQIRFDYEKATMKPRSDAVAVLATIKSKGYKVGLISDCSAEAPAIWLETPLAAFFDAAIFSCQVGIKKPDLRIYQLALDRLKVEPGTCCYIGDGSSRELTGATQAGMRAVQLRVPGEDNPDVYRVDKEDWRGTTIKSLSETLKLLE